jgi:ketosteroid isomerase-like protein
MRIIRPILMATAAAVLLTAYGFSRGWAQPAIKSETSTGQEKASGAEFESMLTKLDAAQQEFHNGRPAALKALWSHADDVTLAGGSGGAIEKGWEHVSRRLDWASSQYSNGVQTNERVVVTVSGNFAYVVQAEHIRFHVPRQERESKRDYRITMVFRREPEGWRIVHRQADTQTLQQTAH